MLNKKLLFLASFWALCIPVIDSRGVLALDQPEESVWTKLDLHGTIVDRPEMPILAYITMPSAGATDYGHVGKNPSYINHSTFKQYQDAGFNIVCPMYSTEPELIADVIQEIEICNELGLGYLVRDLRVRASSERGTVDPGKDYFKGVLEGDAAWYLKEPSVVGVQVIDEPNYLDLKPIGDFYHALAEVDNTKVGFTNLFPFGASGQQLAMEDDFNTIGAWETYKKYATHFLDTTNSTYVLYDQYFSHIHQNPLTPDTTHSTFRSLSFYSNLTRQRGIVFWSAVASYRHGSHSLYTPKETRWTTNISLAYGAKGIEYYTYWPSVAGVDETTWANPGRAGMVTEGGIPHDTYYTIQDINKNIKAVDEYLMPAEFKGMHRYGEAVTFLEECDIINPPSVVDVKGGNALMGIFKNGAKDVYYIVNNSIDCGLTPFTVTFPKKANAHLVNGSTDKQLNSVYAAGFTLSAGEAMLLEVEL